MSRALSLLIPALLVLVSAGAAPNPRIPPIKTVKGAQPNKAAFKASKATKPLVLKSAKDAAKYFDKAGLAKLKKQVDFKQQIVLVFAWQGSGGDQLRYAVAESFPEQIHYSYKRGLTDDLKTHVHVYALRSNVKWRVRPVR